MYKDHEGYADPTAGAALSRMMKEYHEEKKKNYEIKNRPKVYVVSRYSGDIEKNTAAAKAACRYVAEQKRIPVAGHLMYPNMGFDDNNPAERKLCRMFALALLALCDEVWCFTTDGVISEDMRTEINEAKRLHIPIQYFNLKGIAT